MWILAINKVLYNDHITKYRRVLAKDNKGFKFEWTNNSDIPVRKIEQSRFYRIRNENDWNNLK